MADELRGWKEIGAHFGISERTAQRWEREYGMPVHRAGRTRGASVFALLSEVDHWRVSPEGLRASSEDREIKPPDAAAPSPARFRARRLVVAAVVVLAAAAGILWLVRPGRPVRDKSPAGRRVAHGYAAPASSAVFLLRVTTPGIQPVVLHVLDGAMATIEVRDGAKLGLVPDRPAGPARLAVYRFSTFTSGDEAVRELQVLPLPRGTSVHVEQLGLRLDVEWFDTVNSSVLPVRGPGAPPPRCCIVCGNFTVCASQVAGDCGNCCGFEGCRRPE